jgi:predicted nucleic acid-binding Zn ribbon protein
MTTKVVRTHECVACGALFKADKNTSSTRWKIVLKPPLYFKTWGRIHKFKCTSCGQAHEFQEMTLSNPRKK